MKLLDGITVKNFRDILDNLPDDMALTITSSIDPITMTPFINVRVNLEIALDNAAFGKKA